MQAGGTYVREDKHARKKEIVGAGMGALPTQGRFYKSQPRPTETTEEAQQDVTFEDPVQLENTWSFWHDKYIGPSQSVEEYEASLHKLCTFTTIQDFWKNFNNLPTIDKLKVKSSFHMMKAGIRPIWEDPENANGGFWAMRVRREDTEYTWKELVLAAIGEQFGPVLSNDDDICGVTVSLRQYDNIIEVWNSNASANVNAILARIKSIVPSVEFRNPFYKAHREHTAFNAAKTHAKK